MNRRSLGKERSRLLGDEMRKQGLEIVLLTDRELKMWLTGADGAAVVLISSDPAERVACYVDSMNIPLFTEGNWLDVQVYRREFAKETVLSLWQQRTTLSSQWELDLKELRNIINIEFGKKRNVAVDSLPWTAVLEWPKTFEGQPMLDGSQLVWRVASLKDSDALKRSTLAAEISIQMMRVGLTSLKTGLSEASVQKQMAKIGCEAVEQTESSLDPMYSGVAFEGDKAEAIAQFGRKTSYAHGAPGEEKLKEKDLVRLIALANVDHYWSEFELTAAFGRPSEEMANWLKLKREVLSLTVQACKAGEPIFEVHRKARTYLDSFGFWDGAPIGHGVGLKFHELPYIDRPMRSELSDTSFQNSQTFAVEPDFYIPEKFGFRDSAMIVIDNQTPRLLADPVKFEDQLS
jgi:Xaa-Pro dipeptidase